ncbi:hypothetical protein OZ411_15945 [Bradyrhizobium sp. Arg237L]|uniref:hypothetical protein n=1 Tax=Bradyrhizobium sp. Arg237L TaxID=3003352 RepID=UPI00249E8B05|nr:hypothetical protein [Bradyrhizobium sp. Arg237L]MDI4234299.1 hypothetical protein [Bradyrhizobium sp. Arg237L]
MTWLFVSACIAVAIWFARRGRQKAAERAAAGLLRSPLYWTASLLTFTLLGLVMYMAHIHQQGPIPTFFWAIVVLLFATILLMRRALKWRHPI